MGSWSASTLVRRAAILGALAALVLCAFAGPASAAAPCWKRLTLDWAADSTVNGTYPLPCYTEAIANLQPDQQLYSSAEDDIRRALQRAVANTNNPDSSASGDAAEDASTDDDDGVPTPLLVLGGVALVLVAIGAVGLLRRRGRPGEPGPS